MAEEITTQADIGAGGEPQPQQDPSKSFWADDITQFSQAQQPQEQNVNNEPNPTPAPQEPIAPITEVAPTPNEPAQVQQNVSAPTQEEIDYYEKIGLPKGGGEFKDIIEAAKQGKEALKKFVDNVFADYRAMTDEQLIRMKFDEEKQHLTKEERDTLFQHKLRTYGFTGDDEEDALAKLLMKDDAEAYRNGKIEAQSKFVLPNSPYSNYEAKLKEQQLQIQQQQKELQDLYARENLAFETNRKLTLGEGETAYSFEVPATVDVKEILINNPQKLFEPYIKVVGDRKVIDWNGLTKLVNYANNMAVVEKSLINHGITLGEKKEIDSLGNNPMSVNGQAPPSSGKSYWV